MARRFGVLTTCSAGGWDEYGSRMVESCLKFLPEGVRLYLYTDFKVRRPSDRLVVRKIPEVCPDLVEFQNTHGVFDFATGGGVAESQHDTAYNSHIIWNALKFSHKVFTVEHAVLNAEDEDVMVWLDADTLAFDRLDQDLLEATIPASCMLGYLGRSWKYSECGYVAYNLGHPATRMFASAMASMYKSGSVYSLKEWHDSYVFDVMREFFERNLGVQNHNISRDVAEFDHVFVNCELGRRLDHLKGPRKAQGRSRARDLHTHDDIAYWQVPPSDADGPPVAGTDLE